LPHFFFENKGGGELQSFYLAKELLKRNWDVHYIKESSNNDLKEQIIQGIVIHSMPKRKGILRWRNYKKLKSLLDKLKPDFCYQRTTNSYLPLLVRIAKTNNIKTIFAFSMHNQIQFWEDIFSEKKIKTIIIKFLEKIIFIYSFKKADLIIVQTKFQKKIIKSKYSISSELIYNAHPLPTCKKFIRENIILWIGRLTANKNPLEFINLAKMLRSTKCRFFLIGAGNNRVLLNKIKEYSISLKNFIFLGELSNNDVHELLSRAKILVNTSFLEGFPNTFIEAWLRGVPVVSKNIDHDDLIQKNNLGKVSGSLHQMAKDISEIVYSEVIWEKYSKSCYKFACENFNIVNAVSKFEDLINKI